MMRNLGGSIGIAVLSTVIDRREQHFPTLAEAITVNAARTQQRLAALGASLYAHITDPVVAKAQALAMLAAQVRREATIMACADGFYLVGVGLTLSLAAIALLKKPKAVANSAQAH